MTDLYRIIQRLDDIAEGSNLNRQQTAVKQMPALFKMKPQGPVLGGDPNKPAPSQGYFFGGEGEESPTANRGGYNKLRDRKDYLDKRDILFRQLTPGIDPETRQAIKDRLAHLEKAAEMSGLKEDESENPMRDAVLRRIGGGRLDLIEKYGLDRVMDAVDDVTSGDTDWEEIGSSDVSAYVKYVEDYLRDHHGSREEMDDRKPFAETTSTSQFKTKDDAISYAKEKVKTFRDNLDGIEIYDVGSGYDVVHTMNWSGRQSVIKNGGRKITTIYPEKKHMEESATTEDVISSVKKKLGDYLADLSKEIKSDPDLKDKIPAGIEQLKTVKTITTDDGKEIKIHGNEDDGFRITIKNKELSSKFRDLDEAVMACEMYCARRRRMSEQQLNNDYLEER